MLQFKKHPKIMMKILEGNGSCRTLNNILFQSLFLIISFNYFKDMDKKKSQRLLMEYNH